MHHTLQLFYFSGIVLRAGLKVITVNKLTEDQDGAKHEPEGVKVIGERADLGCGGGRHDSRGVGVDARGVVSETQEGAKQFSGGAQQPDYSVSCGTCMLEEPPILVSW